MTETYRAEELDPATRDYLLQAKKREGEGLPGVYSPKSDYVPIVSLFLGFGIIIATLLAALPPTEHPIREAMLQTAGILLGGWLIIAAFRIWAGHTTGSNLGKFVYADADHLYEANGSTVQVTDLRELDETGIDHNYNENTYQNSTVKLRFPKQIHPVTLQNEHDGNQFNVFLNTIAYMRHGGENGSDQQLQRLSSEEMGDIAKDVVKTGSFPRNLQAGHSDYRIPHPQRTGRPSSGILPILITFGIGVALFLGFRLFNEPFRDETLFARIKALPPKEQPPHLRDYLSHPQFTRHRDEAQKLLEEAYDRSVAQNVLGKNEEAKKGFAQTLLSLKKQPRPVISLRVKEEGGDPEAKKSRESQIAKDLADRWGATVGDELVFFVQVDDQEIKSLIDLSYKLIPNGLDYTIQFRTSPDVEPHATYSGKVATIPGRREVDVLVQIVLEQTVGQTRLRPPPPPTDGDF